MRVLAVFLFWCLAAIPASGGPVRVAVATNFHTTAKVLAQAFTRHSGHDIEIISGATGALYAQVVLGAPFDVFLSADRARVTALDEAGLLVPGARQIYAEGLLVLWSPDASLMAPDAALSLERDTTRHFAMADPDVAPYGLAAEQVLAQLGLEDIRHEKAVIGASVGQAFALVATGNAQMGFVALAQVQNLDGAWYRVPDGLHDPVLQEAGLLLRAQDNAAARAFFDWLGGDEAGQIIREAGYRRSP